MCMHVTVHACKIIRDIQEELSHCVRWKQKNKGVCHSLQPHNRRKVKLAFPRGESNIIFADRSCQITIWLAGLTELLLFMPKSTACSQSAELTEAPFPLFTVQQTHCFVKFNIFIFQFPRFSEQFPASLSLLLWAQRQSPIQQVPLNCCFCFFSKASSVKCMQFQLHFKFTFSF